MPLISLRAALGALVTTSVIAAGGLVAAPAAHAVDLDCPDFSSQREAQLFFLDNGGPQSDPHRLDADGDGIACESNPAPYYYGTTPSGGGGGGGSQPNPEPEPEPEPVAVRSTVRLTVSPSARIAGEKFRMSVSVRPRISRDVLIQRRVDGRWRQFGSGTTTQNGETYGYFRSPATSQTYRVVLRPLTRGGKRYSAAGSESRALRVLPQRVALELADRTVGEGQRVSAVARATPVRAGRRVAVQRWTAGGWRTVDTRAMDRRGHARFTLAPALGRSSFRAVVLRSRGAASRSSRAVSVVASDRTPPPAPYDLVAQTDGGTVTLSWSRTVPADFSHHEVWLRTDDTSWYSAHTTDATTFTLTDLQPGVAYSFMVRSVDTSGNRSAPGPVVRATPEAPAEQTLRVG